MDLFWRCFWSLTIVASLYSDFVAESADDDEFPGAYQRYINRHNYGYLLKFDRAISMATYDARLIFHMTLPRWQVEFDNSVLDCRSHVNNTIARECSLMIYIRNAVREVSWYNQRYIQQQVRRIHQVILDLPIAERDRARRGVLTDILSHATGLATIDDLRAVEHILEQIETGVYEAARLWGSGAKSLSAALQIQQGQIQNVFDILAEYRYSIRDLQHHFVQSAYSNRAMVSMLFGKTIHFLTNATRHRAEVDALYNAVQFLMAGNIPHFLLPHDNLTYALDLIQRHLDSEQPHMTLSRRDLAYYYNEASFKTFRKDNVLFIVIRAPVIVRTFDARFQLYDVVKLPLLIPDKNDFYCRLATDIKAVAFARDSEYIIQITEGNQVPIGNVWQVNDGALAIIDRAHFTCARALIDGNLPNIKIFCRYLVHKPPFPRGVIKIAPNIHLLTNISVVKMRCHGQSFRDNVTTHVTHLRDLQVVHTVDCHCDVIMADEYRIIADLGVCNDSQEISAAVAIEFPINLVYLSEYFEFSDLSNISAETRLNQSLNIQFPDLAVADRLMDVQFAKERSAEYDMEHIINVTKNSGLIYDDMAHYLFNKIVQAHNLSNSFDLFSPWTWINIFGCLAGVIALVLVILLRMKVRPLFLLLMSRGSHAAPLTSGLNLGLPKLTLSTPSPMIQTTFDFMSEWINHVSHVPNLLPAELLILFCLIFAFFFKIIRIIYRAKKAQTARTCLVLEIGNGTDTVFLSALDLPYAPKHYRLHLNRMEINLRLYETRFGAQLAWSDGVKLINTVLDMAIPLPRKIRVPFWRINKLRMLLQTHYYATIQILTDLSDRSMEIVVLRQAAIDTHPQALYPSLPPFSALSHALSAPTLTSTTTAQEP